MSVGDGFHLQKATSIFSCSLSSFVLHCSLAQVALFLSSCLAFLFSSSFFVVSPSTPGGRPDAGHVHIHMTRLTYISTWLSVSQTTFVQLGHHHISLCFTSRPTDRSPPVPSPEMYELLTESQMCFWSLPIIASGTYVQSRQRKKKTTKKTQDENSGVSVSQHVFISRTRGFAELTETRAINLSVPR